MNNLQSTQVEALKAGLQGAVILPDDPAYEEARQVWNAMIDKHPAAIVRCATTRDVVHAVNFARDHVLPLAVRGGGHNIAGSALCDDGIVIDLSPMKATQINANARRGSVEGGATLADFDAATQAHGLAVPLGINSTTGIASLTLGGGFG
ncbi:MAG: FAD-linked oxidase [Polaromonas sp.]|nr:FAD-linked oxidase [Polaromonas sp.]